MKPNYLLAVFFVLCVVSGLALAHALSASLWWGASAGVFAGALPIALGRMAGMPAGRCAEALGFTLLVAIGAVVCMEGIVPVLNGASVRVEQHLPLLLLAPAVYVVYLAQNRAGAAARELSVADRLGVALGGPPLVLTLALAVAVAGGTLLWIRYVGLASPSWQGMAAKFVERGLIPPLTLALFFWGLLLLANKAWVLWREQRAMAHPERNEDAILVRAQSQALAAEEADVDDYMHLVWKKAADFYVVPRYVNWAIPILGFIGTVLGISLAAAGIQDIIGSGDSLGALSTELGQAIAPLGIAFDTTLIALSLSVFLMLIQTALQRWEDDVLVRYEGRVRAGAMRHGQPDKGLPTAAPGDPPVSP